MAVAFLAVSSCAISAPLNPAYSKNEFDFYLSDLKATALIVPAGSDSPAVEAAASRGIPVLELISAPDAPAGCFSLSEQSLNGGKNAGSTSAGDTALTLHTSGTRSRPKMVPLTRSRFHLGRLSSLRSGQHFSYLHEHFAMLRENLRDRCLQSVYDACVRRKYPLPRIAVDVRYANRRAERRYKRRPYPGKAAIIKTTDPAGGIFPAPLNGWQDLLRGSVEEYDVPGSHRRMLAEPAVDSVARILRIQLGKAAAIETP